MLCGTLNCVTPGETEDQLDNKKVGVLSTMSS